MKTIHDDRYRALIRLLIAEREQQDVTQTALAQQLGRPQSFIAKVENLERRLDVIELADWLHALGVEPREFTSKLLWW